MIGFAGLSHLGLVSSLAAAAKGLRVTGYDPDPALSEALRGGRLPVHEEGLAELLQAHRGNVTWTSDPVALGTCELIVCSADTPTDTAHLAQLAGIEALLETAATQARAGAVLVVLSQVPPGFARRAAERIARQRGRAVSLYGQVETLVIGEAVKRALTPERFIVGCADPRAPLPEAYRAWLAAFGCPILPMRYESAELAKIAINLFLASSVSTANTLAELCESIGADWSEITPALTSDRRIGPHAYVRAGLGLGGGNIERDLAAARVLAQEHGTESSLLDACLANSRHRRAWALRVLSARVLGHTEQPQIAVWGLAYKPGTRSTMHAPALDLLEALRPFAVRAYDPAVTLNGAWPHVTQAASAQDACRGADALAVLTPWPEFARVEPAQVRQLMRGRTVVDPFGVLDAARCAQAGLEHARLGAPAAAGAGEAT